jgi:hypothetical protein
MMVMASLPINVCSISWIDRDRMSPFVSMPVNIFAADAWLNQLCYGMRHTANDPPPTQYYGGGYISGYALSRQYRSLTSYFLELDIDPSGKLLRFRQIPGFPLILDAGYTPPFDSGWELFKGEIGTSILSPDPTDAVNMRQEATRYSPGEASSMSKIVVPTDWQSTSIKPSDCSTIKVPANEIILAHCLIKFRAGKAGDYIAVAVMYAPNHVPWVWCESILTYAAPKTLMLYGRGSGFPNHAFYCQNDRRGTLELTNDRAELRKIFTTGLKATMAFTPDYDSMPGDPPRAYKEINDQAPTTEVATAGQSIPDQPYTAPANPNTIRAAITL